MIDYRGKIHKTRCESDVEWRELRNHAIGGSDAACVIGFNPYKSAYTLWAEKTGKIQPPDLSMKESVRLGNYLEDYVAKRFEEETGKKVRKENATWSNDDFPFAHANFDRLLVGEYAGLEIKTTSELNLKKFKNGEYPANYYCQMVHYLMVSGYDRWYLAVLVGNKEIKIFCLERDQDEIDAIANAEKDFWECVKNGTPPAIDGMSSTTDTISELYANSEDETVDITLYQQDMENYFRLLDQKNNLDIRIAEIHNKLKSYMEEAAYGQCEIAKVSWKTQTRKTFDVKRFIADNPSVNLDGYYKESSSRVFKIKGLKQEESKA